MGIDGDYPRRVREQGAIGLDGAHVIGVGQCVLQIAHVVREHGLAVAQQAKRVLQLAPHRQHGWGRVEAAWQRQRRGRVTPRSPQHAGFAAGRAHQGIIDPARDVAVVQQKALGDTGKPVQRLVVGDALRLVGNVAAGHHQRAVDVAQQQVVQRSARQHEAERRQPRRHARERPQGPRFQHRDRRRRASQSRRIGRRDHGEPADHREVARHQRERLGVAALALSQLGHGFDIGRVAGQMEAADPLHREDTSGEQQGARRTHRVGIRRRAPATRGGHKRRRRSVARESAGRWDRRTRPRSPGRDRTPAWSWYGGRRESPR